MKSSSEILPDDIDELKNMVLNWQENISIASMPKLFLPKSIAAPSLVAFTVTSKYIDHLPLYRQEAMWERYGIKLPRNTTCGWLMKAYEKMLPLLPLLKADIIASGYIQADETPVQVMREPRRRNQQKSYMWIYRGNAPNRTAVYYEYQETEPQNIPRNSLVVFKVIYKQTAMEVMIGWIKCKALFT